jgi:ribosomal protein S18 acetylase RimI-like enzyme
MTELRRALPSDATDLARLRATSLTEQGYLTPAQREPFVERATLDFARLFAQGRLVGWLLCAGDTIVGSAYATYFDRLPYPDGTLHAELSGVYVDPAFRRAGQASRLVAAVVAEIRNSPARKAFLRPSATARSLYRVLGFVDDATGVMNLGASGTSR